MTTKVSAYLGQDHCHMRLYNMNRGNLIDWQGQAGKLLASGLQPGMKPRSTPAVECFTLPTRCHLDFRLRLSDPVNQQRAVGMAIWAAVPDCESILVNDSWRNERYNTP